MVATTATTFPPPSRIRIVPSRFSIWKFEASAPESSARIVRTASDARAARARRLKPTNRKNTRLFVTPPRPDGGRPLDGLRSGRRNVPCFLRPGPGAGQVAWSPGGRPRLLEEEVEELSLAEHAVELPDSEEWDEGDEHDDDFSEDLVLPLIEHVLEARREGLMMDEPLDDVLENREKADEDRIDDRGAQRVEGQRSAGGLAPEPDRLADEDDL